MNLSIIAIVILQNIQACEDSFIHFIKFTQLNFFFYIYRFI